MRQIGGKRDAAQRKRPIVARVFSGIDDKLDSAFSIGPRIHARQLENFP